MLDSDIRRGKINDMKNFQYCLFFVVKIFPTLVHSWVGRLRSNAGPSRINCGAEASCPPASQPASQPELPAPDTSRAPHQIAQLNLKTLTTSTEVRAYPSSLKISFLLWTLCLFSQGQISHVWYFARSQRPSRMSEAHFDEFEHYNFDQDKAMRSGHSGKQNFLKSKLTKYQ